MSHATVKVKITTPDGRVSKYRRMVVLDPKTERLEGGEALQFYVGDVAYFMRKVLIDGRSGDDV